jgi:hypothetical protein
MPARITPHGDAAVLKPIQITITARFLLAGGVLTLVPAMLLPSLQGAEAALGLTDKHAHALAFYFLTMTSFVASPRLRRSDLALAAIALGAAMEVAQLVVGREAGVGDVVANATGVALAWAPGALDDIRRLARKHPGRSFAEIKALDRRRRRSRRAPTPGAADAQAASSVRPR